MSPRLRDRIGATPGKLVLVGALAAVLAIVLASNRGGSAESAVAHAAAAPQTGAASPATARTANAPKHLGENRDWPTVSLDDVIRFDPLAAPTWAADEQVADGDDDDSNAKSLEELRTAANAIIFIADGQRVARIGQQEYRVGDRIGRYEIADISSQGIVLSEPAAGAGNP